MKKSDLRTGMRVTTRNGGKFIILLNCSDNVHKHRDIMTSLSGIWSDIDEYEEDLTCRTDDIFDIMTIEIPEYSNDLFSESCKFETLWQRQEIKEMTIEEIQKELGYKIKVVEKK